MEFVKGCLDVSNHVLFDKYSTISWKLNVWIKCGLFVKCGEWFQLYLKHKYTDCFIKLQDIDIVPVSQCQTDYIFSYANTQKPLLRVWTVVVCVWQTYRKCKCFRVWIVNTDMPSEINLIRIQEHELIAMAEWDDKCENTNDPEKSAQICIDFSK